MSSKIYQNMDTLGWLRRCRDISWEKNTTLSSSHAKLLFIRTFIRMCIQENSLSSCFLEFLDAFVWETYPCSQESSMWEDGHSWKVDDAGFSYLRSFVRHPTISGSSTIATRKNTLLNISHYRLYEIRTYIRMSASWKFSAELSLKHTHEIFL